MYSPDLCLPLTIESVPSSFLGFIALILVVTKCKCLFLSDGYIFLRWIVCVCLSLIPEYGHKK